MSKASVAAVLVVDHDPDIGREILDFLGERNYAVVWAADAEKAYNHLDDAPFDVLVAELNVTRGDGMRLMQVAKERNPDICVVFVTRKPDIERATEAMRQGAYDFQTKPLNLPKLEAVIQRGLAYQRLVLEQVELRRRLDERFGLGRLVGQSRQMTKVYSAVRQIGPGDGAVLIYGEPGTGKDLIAQALHNNSPRRDEAFVTFDCSNMPESVTERELFGHLDESPSRGLQGRRGRFEMADLGTLYLDGVEELTPALQERLMLFLERRVIRRGGDEKRIKVNVRLIAATNQRLDKLAAAGRFDTALSERLMAVSIEAPALRARREDIPLLVQQALAQSAKNAGKAPLDITRNAVNLLVRYDWPGNARELDNVVEGMAATAAGTGPLGVDDIPEYVRREAAPEAGEIRIPTGASMKDIERIAIEETMNLCGYDKERCAKTLGIGLRTLYRKLAEYDIR
jgi:DNA-binding NtrC family response regulator